MKYKLSGIIASIVVIALVATTLVIARSDDNRRYHQHIEAQPKSECSHDESVFCTHLPLVQIDTDNTQIPGKPVYDEYGNIIGHTQTADGSDEIVARIKITDNEQTNNHEYDTPDIESFIKIHVRGNSSRTFDKSSYDIRLITESGQGNDFAVMGMDVHSEWILYGPYLDKTLIRNYLWYNIAGEIMDYSPNVRFCEVILNSEYQGLYVMCESITAGKEVGRLNLSVSKKNSTFSGYLLRLDRGSINEIKNIETFSAYTYRTNNVLNIVYPGSINLNEEIANSILQDFSYFEKALYSYDYNDDTYGYRKMIDVESFADYFILNEFTCNYDAGAYSTYIYKDIDGKYRLAIWDFNSACDNYQETSVRTDHFKMQNCLWYFMLTKDEYFTEQVISRYEKLRNTFLSEEYLDAYIDGVIEYLGDAIDRNYEKWGYSFEEESDLLTPADRNPRSFEEAVCDLKEFLHNRGKWLDENITVLKQYSSESKVKKFNENAN